MEECIISINRLAAVYLYKSCKWKLFIYIVIVAMGALGLLSCLSNIIKFKELSTLLTNLLGASGEAFLALIIFISVLFNGMLIVAGIFGIQYVKQCKYALLAGDDVGMENALYKGKIQSQIVGIALLSLVSLCIICALAVTTIMYGKSNGLW